TPPPTAPYTLSLHDALPISSHSGSTSSSRCATSTPSRVMLGGTRVDGPQTITRAPSFTNPWMLLRATRLWAMSPTSATVSPSTRSEEHTSELQSRGHLVCRL